jgi:peptide chain release factor subunit 1
VKLEETAEKLDEYRLERLVKELKKKSGRGTELVSLYIPAARQLSDITALLREEYSTASNIKDRTTRHHVLEALTTIMQRLKLFRMTPPNGLIVFCGYVAGDKPGSEVLEVHLLEPPKPLSQYLYRCDSRFHTEILERMLEKGHVYGLIAMDKEEATFAIVRGGDIEILESITSGVPGKHKSGGQSARRFERIIEVLTNEFFHRISERMKRYFVDENHVEGVLIGGPGPTKNDFVDGDYIPYELKNKILGIVDIGYTDESGIRELIEKGKEYIKESELVKEREIINNVLELISKEPEHVAIGIKEVMTKLNEGRIQELVISKDVTFLKVSYVCNDCGYSNFSIIDARDAYMFKLNLKCESCGSTNLNIVEEDITDNIINDAKKQGAIIHMISGGLDEAEMLRNAFNGVVAILR